MPGYHPRSIGAIAKKLEQTPEGSEAYYALAEEYFDKKEELQRNKNDRFSWLKQHPEDIPMDEENQALRNRGFDDDGFRALMAAICLRTCSDYQKISRGKTVHAWEPAAMTALECRIFFNGDMMKYFTNGMKAEEVMKHIRSMPEDQSIHAIWRRMDGGKKTEEEYAG